MNTQRHVFGCLILLLSISSSFAASSTARPNIVLVLFEDMSPRIGALGDTLARTPTLDALAAESMSYTRAFTAAGVCAPSRAALITGRYAPSIGAQHMRTHGVFGLAGGGPQNYYAVPPAEVKAFPELLRAAGYYTSNNYKTDYQFGDPESVWDESSNKADWRGRRPGQPFFSMFTIMIPHESYLWPTDAEPENRLAELILKRNRAELNYDFPRTDPETVTVPPYLPDTTEVRTDIARQYDNIHIADRQFAKLLERIEADGLLDETILVVSTDHGDGLPRAKRSLYDSGLHVPLFIRYPDRRFAGLINKQLVSFVDLAPTILEWAGVDVPEWMHGRPIARDSNTPIRDYVFATQDRMDNRTYLRRAVRDQRFKLIVNFRPGDPYFEHIPFRDALPTMSALWQGLEAGTLPPPARRLFEPLPEHQLYDTHIDPHETNNLAGDVQYAQVEHRLRDTLDDWLSRVDDMSMTLNEEEMIERFWPGGVQPVTQPPVFELVPGGLLAISSATEGASLEWRCPPAGRWQLYTGPVPSDCAQIEARAVRYGYRESEVVRFPLVKQS